MAWLLVSTKQLHFKTLSLKCMTAEKSGVLAGNHDSYPVLSFLKRQLFLAQPLLLGFVQSIVRFVEAECAHSS